jgi:glutamate decarboxylase
LLLKFVTEADEESAAWSDTASTDASNGTAPARRCNYQPAEVQAKLKLELPQTGQGLEGITSIVERILDTSVNTWGQGFLSKLYAGPTSVGAISELILGVINSNVHVFKVSPALTVLEKATGKALASMFGFNGPRAGGMSQPGGSASNLTALVIARNSLFPDTKEHGCGSKKLVLFTAAHGHYSFEKAAQISGLGSAAARSVPVDESGCMIVAELEKEIKKARAEGCTPFFVNATAGTTVLGSYDPFTEIAAVCKREGLWFHVDGSWGAGVVFSRRQKHKLRGSELADSISFNPHKMLNVPVTCSFLLAKDLKQFWKSNTLPASYLFHTDDEAANNPDEDAPFELWDMADMSLQCGRKGDALKMALAWVYYGTEGFERRVDHAFAIAEYFAQAVDKHPDLDLISTNPPPCLQVCFYYKKADTAEENTRVTSSLAKKLQYHNFHVDFAAGDQGSLMRAVVSLQTERHTIDHLVKLIEEIGVELCLKK